NAVKLYDLDDSEFTTGGEIDRLACKAGYASGSAFANETSSWSISRAEAIAFLQSQIIEAEDPKTVFRGISFEQKLKRKAVARRRIEAKKQPENALRDMMRAKMKQSLHNGGEDVLVLVSNVEAAFQALVKVAEDITFHARGYGKMDVVGEDD